MLGLLGTAGASVSALQSNKAVETEAAVTPSTFRLWFYRNAHYEYGYTWKIWDGVPKTVAYEPVAYITHYGMTLQYYELPTTITKINFQVWEGGDCKENIPEITYSAGDNAYLWFADATDGMKVLKGHDYPSKVYIDFLQDVFAGYYTCSDDLNNGFGSFDKLYKTWVYNSSSRLNGYDTEDDVLNALKGFTINGNDYAWSEEAGVVTYDYADAETKTLSTTLYDKVMKMHQNYDRASSAKSISQISESKNNFAGVFAVTIVASAAISVGGWLVLRKKHERD